MILRLHTATGRTAEERQNVRGYAEGITRTEDELPAQLRGLGKARLSYHRLVLG